MRFIIQSRSVINALNDGEALPPEAFALVPLDPLIDDLRPYGQVRENRFMAAYTIEVDNVNAFTSEIPAREARYDCEIRPARAIHEIAPAVPLPAVNTPGAAMPADPEPEVPASILKLGVKPLWDLGFLGKGARIGVIDRGFSQPLHDSLVGRVTTHHYYEAKSKAFIKDGWPGNQAVKHGTFAAALIAGKVIAGKQISVAPHAELHLVELPGPRPEERLEDDLAQAIEFLAKDQKCKVISLSLGCWEPTSALNAAIFRARRDYNCLTVVAIGNDGKGIAMWPGAASYALSVGFCGETGGMPRMSGSTHFGRGRNALVPLVVAPGILLNSAQAGGLLTQGTGSSFSAPLVAGLAGLLISACTNLKPDHIEEAITLTCEYRSEYDERCKFGLPSGVKALEYLRTHKMC